VAVQRQGRAVLLAAVLAATLVGVTACGDGGGDEGAGTGTATTPSPTATATEPTAPVPAATANPSETAAAAIVVTSPAEGATVNRTFTVTGTSRTAEGTLIWALARGEEVVVNDVAQGGSDGAAPFRFTVTAPAAGTYTLRVFEESAKDGEAKNEVTRTVTVR
jgi:hypothetical protein